MEFSELLNKFLATIDEILTLIDTGEDKNQAKLNLVNAAYLNFAAIAAENPKFKDVFVGSSDGYSSLEEFEKKVEETKLLFGKNGGDFTGDFKKAMKQTISDFASGFEFKLTPEKVVELKKLINEGF